MAQTPKAQKRSKAKETQHLKATIHEIHMSMLGLKHLNQVRDKEQKST